MFLVPPWIRSEVNSSDWQLSHFVAYDESLGA